MGHYSHEGCNERLQNLNAINKIGPNRTLLNVSSYVKVKLRIETFGSDRISDKDFRIGSDYPIRNYPIRSDIIRSDPAVTHECLFCPRSRQLSACEDVHHFTF